MLIGRLAERQALAQIAAVTLRSESSALLLVGEAGLGKTALLAHLAAEVPGFRTLWVHGCDDESTLPFSGLDQLVRPVLDHLAEIPRPQAAALSAELALGAHGDVDRYAVSAAAVSLLSKAAAARPLLVLVDDAHALDAPSAAALAFTARRIAGVAVGIVIASRPGGVLLKRSGIPRLDLAGLTGDEVRALLHHHARRPIAQGLAQRVFDATAGNPLAVAELASAVEVLEAQTPAAIIEVPGRATNCYADHVLALPPRTRATLLVAALAANYTDTTAALALLGLDVADARAAEADGLVSLLPGALTFRDPMARSSVYRVASAQQRRAAHLAIATVTGDPDRRAWHLAEGTIGVDADVAEDVAAAGERSSARGAHEVATAAFERAAMLSPAREQRAARLLAAARAATLIGLPDRAEALLDRAAAESADALHEARADALRAVVAQRWGTLERSRELSSHALPALLPLDPAAAVDAATDLVTTAYYQGDGELSARAAWLLAGLGERCSPPIGVRACAAGGLARTLAGRDGFTQLRAAMTSMATQPAEAIDELRPSWPVMAKSTLHEISAPADQLLELTLQHLRESTAPGPAAEGFLHAARCATSMSRWAQAAALYQEGIRRARESDQQTILAMLLAGLAWLEARRGAGRCRTHAKEAEALAQHGKVPLAEVWAAWALADLELGAGRVTEALAQYEALQGVRRRIGHRDVSMSPAPELVECLLRVGRRQEAADVAATFSASVRPLRNPWSLGRAERATALVATSPAPGLRRACALFTEGSDRFEEARTQLALGETLRRGRRRTQAREILRSALATFDVLRAEPWAERTAVELEATGEHAHRRGDRSVDLLTPQELQVARLLAAGRTTKQAAAALFLSPKTIEYHLRHVYTKLDVHDRTALADVLAQPANGTSPG